MKNDSIPKEWLESFILFLTREEHSKETDLFVIYTEKRNKSCEFSDPPDPK